MSCLNANITRGSNAMSLNVTAVNENLLANVTNKEDGMFVKLSVVCGHPLANITRGSNAMSFRVIKANENLFASVTKKENGISVKLSMVCSLSKVIEYLRVSPSDIQWITDDIGVYFDVESNVKWIVTTD
jgi:Trp operon repressor